MNTDMTYCISTCTNINCERHSNKIPINKTVSCSNFKDSSLCPYNNKEEKKEK